MYILVDVSSNFIRKRGEYILKLVKYITESLKLKKRGYKIIVFNENIFEEVKSEKELGNYIKELEGIPYLGINIKKIGIFDRFRLDNVGGIILITDAGLWYTDILDLLKKLSKNGINFYVISLNPFLFLDRDFIEENFDKIYDNFLKREEYIKKLLYLGYVVDLGKNDLLDRIFPKRD